MEKTLNCQTDSEYIHAPVTQSMVSICEDDFCKQKEIPQIFCHMMVMLHFMPNRARRRFGGWWHWSIEADLASHIHNSHISSEQQAEACTGAAIVTAFALTIPPEVAAKMAAGLPVNPADL